MISFVFLLPVYPNCHAMLHRRKPPFTPEELKALMDCE
ncbi:HNH endonuclease [Escherichia coli]|nr:HNH endonuclease [Escherichia coli]